MVSDLVISTEAEFERWLVSVLEAERKRLLLREHIPALSETPPSQNAKAIPTSKRILNKISKADIE
jgi:hypothetical protein